MSKDKVKEVKEKKSHGGLKFFLGSLFGFFLCIALIVGVGAFTYFNVSASWLNRTFHAGVNFGNDTANSLTLNTTVQRLMNLANNTSNYSLDDLERDFGFGISDELMGINIESLKAVPFSQIPNEAQNLLSKLSAYDLREIVHLGGMDRLLDKQNTYYLNPDNHHLYKQEGYTDEVSEFDYEYLASENKIEVKNTKFDVQDNVVNIDLRYLPLSTALKGFDDFKVAELLGLKEVNGTYYEDKNNNNTMDDNEEVSGIIQTIANKTVSELSSSIKDIKIKEVLNLSYDQDSSQYYQDKNKNNSKDVGENIASFLNAIADTAISGLTDRVSSLKISDLFPDNRTGLLKLLENSSIESLSEDVNGIITNTSLNNLVNDGVINIAENEKSVLQKDLVGGGYEGKTKIGELSINEFMTYALKAINDPSSLLG